MESYAKRQEAQGKLQVITAIGSLWEQASAGQHEQQQQQGACGGKPAQQTVSNVSTRSATSALGAQRSASNCIQRTCPCTAQKSSSNTNAHTHCALLPGRVAAWQSRPRRPPV